MAATLSLKQNRRYRVGGCVNLAPAILLVTDRAMEFTVPQKENEILVHPEDTVHLLEGHDDEQDGTFPPRASGRGRDRAYGRRRKRRRRRPGGGSQLARHLPPARISTLLSKTTTEESK